MINQLTYHEKEQAVFDAIKANIESTGLYVSLRINGSKNARRDIFIGTEKSNYFKFTLWDIPIGFPGSSGNFMDFCVLKKSDDTWFFQFQAYIPKGVTGDQNRHSLSFLIGLRERIKSEFQKYKHAYTEDHHKSEGFYIESSEEYADFHKLVPDLVKFVKEITPFIDEQINSYKVSNPEWHARRFTEKDWLKMNEAYQRRLEKYPIEKIEEEEIETPENLEEKTLDANKPYFPCNQILFGPPGTGKTYYSINLALKIIGEDTKGTREQIVQNFDQQRKAGKIAFCTFHQSMSYEDFIEGIKPVLDDIQDDIHYEIRDGILKTMTKRAIQQYVKWSSDKELSFEDKYNILLEKISDNEDTFQLKSRTGSTINLTEVTPRDNIIVTHEKGSRNYIVSKQRLEKVYHGLKEKTNISNINQAIRNIIGGSNATAYWAVNEYLNDIRGEKSEYDIKENLTDLQFENIIKNLDWNQAADLDVDRYVLIIDEINRGNVSGIFGELISLLEDDKRLDKTNRLVVKLPYSKIDFGLPSNLYIIGTMNTADRSVEALDTALRRRFSFKEIVPDPTVITNQSEEEGSDDIDGINLVELLRTINSRIEILVDRDHAIGHSYFLKISDLEGLKDVFKNKIIPLLQEYFYNDYSKIILVIGEGFVQKDQIKINGQLFSGQNTGDIDLPEYKYNLIPITKDFDIKKAINILHNNYIETNDEE